VKLSRLCRCGHRFEAHDHYRAGTECVICGSLGCRRFRWRWWPWARTLAATAVAVAAVVLGLAACGSASSTSAAPAPSSAPRPAALPPPPCTWYSAAGAEQVEVSITGPACRHPLTLMGWIAKTTGREWDSTTTAPTGMQLADEARAGSVVRVWFTGPATTPEPSPYATPGASLGPGAAAAIAGQLADALEAAGWSPELATA
jgi:hypothetical protein